MLRDICSVSSARTVHASKVETGKTFDSDIGKGWLNEHRSHARARVHHQAFLVVLWSRAVGGRAFRLKGHMQRLGLLLENAPDSRAGYDRTDVAVERPSHANARALLRLWRERGGTLVVGRDIPGRGIERLLPYLALFEYRPAREDFRVRLAGFALHRRFGRDIAHHYLAEVLARPELESTREIFVDVLLSGNPQIRDSRIRSLDRSMLHIETVLLRAWSSNQEKPLVLAGYFFFDGSRKVNHPVLC